MLAILFFLSKDHVYFLSIFFKRWSRAARSLSPASVAAAGAATPPLAGSESEADNELRLPRTAAFMRVRGVNGIDCRWVAATAAASTLMLPWLLPVLFSLGDSPAVTTAPMDFRALLVLVLLLLLLWTAPAAVAVFPSASNLDRLSKTKRRKAAEMV